MTVDDCNGSVTGSLTDATSALQTGDFNKANCIASHLFNASVAANPDMPDSQSAHIAFMAKFALLTQTPQMTYLMGNTPPLVATDYFGPSGNLDKLGTLANDRWPNASIPGTRGNLAIFLKIHSDMGHSINDVFGKAMELITINFPDLHVLMQAMSQDTQLSLTDINGLQFFQSQWPATQKFTYTEAAIFDLWINFGRVLANLGPRYDWGFSIASLDTMNDLVIDMNTSPRVLTLIGNPNASDAAPLLNDLFNSAIRGVRNSVASPPQTWVGDLFPKDYKGQLNLITLAMDLQASLQGKMTWLASSSYKFAINLQKGLSQLPTSQGVPGDVVKLDSSGELWFTDTFLPAFVAGFSQQR